MSDAFVRSVRRLGSTEATSVLIVLSAAIAAAGVYLPIHTATWMVLPLILLLANLLAALATNARLKSQPMLFAFHAALVAMILTVGLDRLNAMSGQVEVTEGTMFDPALVKVEKGLLHDLKLGDLKFLQGVFEISYAPGMNRRETESLIRVPDGSGGWRDVRIGDDTPLIFGSYRFYTSRHKGFAPVVTYTDAAGKALVGSIHMPSYPMQENNQGITWTPPGSDKPLKVWLHIPEPVYDEKSAWKFSKPDNTRLVLIDGDNRQEIAIGETATVGAAKIRYDSLRSWMGYKIVGDTLNHWIAAASIIACLTLLWHVLSVVLWGARLPGKEVEHGS